jgi:two-component system chemotaxis sensor kinase CheA
VVGVSGAVIRADGSLAIVIDVPHLFKVASEVAESVVAPPRNAARQKVPRILVVDDSLTSRTLERNILVSAGYSVVTAVDGDEALTLLGQSRYDMVVSDVQMPKVDGFELTRRIRGDPNLKNLPVLLVTRLDRAQDLAAGVRAGADEYLTKGEFEQHKLLEAVSRLV